MSNNNNVSGTQAKEIKYFSSVHEETGFVNALTLVKSSGGNYYAIKFAARRGNSQKPQVAPYSVRVNGKQAKEIIEIVSGRVNAQLAINKELWGKKQGKDTETILITLNVSDTVAKSYTRKHDNSLVSYIDGRCTSIAYVRIGDEEIFNKQVNGYTAKVAETSSVPATEEVPS